MKPSRLTLPIALLILSATALAQSDAQKSFDALKSLAGTWQATYEAHAGDAARDLHGQRNLARNEG